MSIHDDIGRIADLVHGSACSTEADKQAWARIRAHLDDQRRRLEAAGETLRAISFGACDRCRLEWRDPDGVCADCPWCRALELQGEADRLRAEADIRLGTIRMAVDRLEGTVEGRPTHTGNFLQRIDELVAMEGRRPAAIDRDAAINRVVRAILDGKGTPICDVARHIVDDLIGGEGP